MATILPGLSAVRSLLFSRRFPSSSRSVTTLDYSLNSVLWQQRSGEYRALCYQAFALAEWQLQERIRQKPALSKPLAIITDIDESVLDNSPQQDQQDADKRAALVDANHQAFGTRFIILPNAIYGDWESAIWNARPVSPKEADRLKHEALESY